MGEWTACVATYRNVPLPTFETSEVVLRIHSTPLRKNKLVLYSPRYCGACSRFSWKSNCKGATPCEK